MKYQDYVIKDGNLIGKFDEMYKIFDDPWEQSTRERNSNEKLIGLEILKRNNHKSVLELGCGHGHYTKKISEITDRCVGVDISENAIIKASTLYPDCNFIKSHIINEDLYRDVDCIMMMEITWYVLDNLKDFKKIIVNHSGIGFFHALNTYPEGSQTYGKDFFTNHDQILNYFSDVIHIEESGIFSKKEYNGCLRTFFYGKIK